MPPPPPPPRPSSRSPHPPCLRQPAAFLNGFWIQLDMATWTYGWGVQNMRGWRWDGASFLPSHGCVRQKYDQTFFVPPLVCIRARTILVSTHHLPCSFGDNIRVCHVENHVENFWTFAEIVHNDKPHPFGKNYIRMMRKTLRIFCRLRFLI